MRWGMRHCFIAPTGEAAGGAGAGEYAHWVRRAGQWMAEGRAFVVVTLLAVAGSAPQKAACKMLVDADGACGTVGGGRLEEKALETAREMLREEAELRVCVWNLSAAVGQCCGGRVAVLFERCAEAAPTTVAVFGVGHVGREVVAVLRRLPYRVAAVDVFEEGAVDLPAEFPAPLRGGEAQMAALPRGAVALIMTHSHAMDFALCCAALEHGVAYVGMIGSAAKAASFRARLRRRGLEGARLRSPIGAGGRYPAEIAVSIGAEVVRWLAPPAPEGGGRRRAAALVRALEEVAGGGAAAEGRRV